MLCEVCDGKKNKISVLIPGKNLTENALGTLWRWVQSAVTLNLI